MDIRESASKAFHEIDCRQAVLAAATHGPRPHYDYQPGQAVEEGDEAPIQLEDQPTPSGMDQLESLRFSCPLRFGYPTTRPPHQGRSGEATPSIGGGTSISLRLA